MILSHFEVDWNWNLTKHEKTPTVLLALARPFFHWNLECIDDHETLLRIASKGVYMVASEDRLQGIAPGEIIEWDEANQMA